MKKYAFTLFALLIFLTGCKEGTRVPESEIAPAREPAPWLQELPALLGQVEGTQDEYIKTVRIREFIASNVNFGGDSIRFNQVDPNWYRNSAASMYEVYNQHLATSTPILTATMLRRLYIDFGFTAYDYDFGVDGQASHAFTLVKIQHYGKERLIIQDATFNLSITDSMGVPWDFFDLVEELKKKDFSNIERRYTDFYPLPGILQEENRVNPSEWIIPDQWSMEKSLNPQYPYRVVCSRSWDHYTEFNRARWEPLMQANGYPKDFLYLIFFPKAVYGDWNYEELEDKIKVAVGKKKKEVTLPDSVIVTP